MANAYEQHDILDESWAKIELLLPGRKGTWGGNARDNRQFINAVFWILRTGAPWRDLPPSYGDWKNTYKRFCRWRDKGVWERLLEQLIDNPEFELLMVGWEWKQLPESQTGSPVLLGCALGAADNLKFMIDELQYPIPIDGIPPLTLAVAYKNYATAKFLLERGIAPIIRNDKGKVIHDYQTSPEIKKLLNEYSR